MSLINQDQLHIPRGAESLHLDEAYKHRNILNSMEDHFHSWGYVPTKTPVLDYYDHYSEYLTSKRKEESYRLIDREGKLLLLRSDITLFLARQMSINLKEAHLPLRTYYADSIMRYQKKEDISHNEFFQAGCELIGKEGLDGDLEILFLLRDNLVNLGLKDFRIHLGSRSLLNCIFSQVKGWEYKQLLTFLINRDRPSMEKIMGHLGMESKEILDLLFFIGTLDEYKELNKDFNSSELKAASNELSYLDRLIEQVKEVGGQEHFRIDFSEIGNQTYYSSLVFQCYAANSDSAIASGGRYDGLISCQGKGVSSVGFSLLLRKLESLLPSVEIPEPIKLKGNDPFSQRYRKAQSMRDEGKSVLL